MHVAQRWQLESLDEFVVDLLDRLEVSRPPVDPLAIAKRLGVQVQRNREQSERGRLRKRHPHCVIVVRPEPRWERTCWTLAHELGELLMPELLDWMQLSEIEHREREWIANEFAQRLLVPTAWLRDKGIAPPYDLFRLKNQYATASHEVVSLQLLSLERPLIVTVFDGNQMTRRRCNLQCRPPKLLSFERKAQQQAIRSSRPHLVHHEGVAAHAWPVHEPDWKREIVLTSFDSSFEFEEW